MHGIQKMVCIVVNMGNFERHMGRYFTLAKQHGQHVFTLTSDGLVDIDEASRVHSEIADTRTSYMVFLD